MNKIKKSLRPKKSEKTRIPRKLKKKLKSYV